MASTILIIEDDKFLRQLIAQKLLKEGYDVSEAIDGEEGLKKVKEEKPDLVLLDLIGILLLDFILVQQVVCI